jgi:hypothetical protein
MLRVGTIAGISLAATAATFGALGNALGRQDSEFEQLLARHRRDISTRAGQAYEHAFTVHYAAGFGAVLGACIQQSGPPSSFEVLYVIDKDGRITRAVAKAPTPLTACVIEAAQRDTFPKPPFSPFHEHVVQNFAP